MFKPLFNHHAVIQCPYLLQQLETQEKKHNVVLDPGITDDKVMPHLPDIPMQTKQSDKEGNAVIEKPILLKFTACKTLSQQSGTNFNPIHRH